MNSVADHRPGVPLSAACAPELIAAKMEAVLMPPSAAISTSRSREPCISRRTSWKNGIVIVRFRPRAGGRTRKSSGGTQRRFCSKRFTRRVGAGAIRFRGMGRSAAIQSASEPA